MTTSRRRLSWRALVAVVAAAAACSRQASIEEHRVAAVVREYNLALPRFYANGSLDRLKAVTSPFEQERLQDLQERLGQAGRALDTRQEEFKVSATKVLEPPDLADLETEETWWYRHVQPASKVEVQPPKRVRYAVRYKVIQRQGRWLVDRLEMLRSEELPVGQ